MKSTKQSEAMVEGGRLGAAFLFGAAAGSLAMWLLSPRTGFENRMRVQQFVRSGRDRISQVPQSVSSLSSSARDAVNRSIGRVQEQIR